MMNWHQYHEKAKQIYERSEPDRNYNIEIFEKPIVSIIEEEKGAYVLAWVWVPDDKERQEG